jgi:hypothetical protein
LIAIRSINTVLQTFTRTMELLFLWPLRSQVLRTGTLRHGSPSKPHAKSCTYPPRTLLTQPTMDIFIVWHCFHLQHRDRTIPPYHEKIEMYTLSLEVETSRLRYVSHR